MARHGPVAAWIVDDTADPQEGPALGRRGPAVLRRPGQARQLPGGRDRLAGERDGERAGGLPAVSAGELGAGSGAAPPGRACRRRRRSGRSGKSRWHRSTLHAEAVPRAPVVADAGYGGATAFREGLTAAGFSYVVGITAETTVWRPGQAPLPPPACGAATAARRPGAPDRAASPGVASSAWRRELPANAWPTVTWREGTRGHHALTLAATARAPRASRREAGRAPPGSGW